MTEPVSLTPETYLEAQRAAEPTRHLAVIASVREGLPIALVEETAERLGLSFKALTHLGILAPRTAAHSKRTGRLSPAQSDRVTRFFRVFQHAVGTFGDSTRAHTWMTRPSRALGEQRPVNLFDTDEGVRLVEDLLNRIDHGLAA
ncbi:putative toxin-antitoxin system antitoxin component, TIGR02293 family [Limimonas halophila]|uniref:Putative toxin-antitoxin system antitoxin component, TIGR02293 family n=1 Tax=Limimonas halophila TaxID=1082479 RepID=A0A1G7R703_9PROT|nr:antitoxin Xre/MbcA/ParS toxin-binding domain-containing protein [Limimonas halophila]SDG06484.1 putative toxin-antitoxin system antitoxin component, TIGR02293 family [Limimonas halophila]